MKTISLLLLFLLIFFSGFSKNKKKDKVFCPPGTLQINDSLFVDETEMSNLGYREMLYWVSKKFGKQSNEYKSMIIDSTVWRNIEIYTSVENYNFIPNSRFEFYYMIHPAFMDCPVVGVTYEQAVYFCKWRTDRVNEWFFLSDKRNKKIKFNPDSNYIIPKVVEYYLPSEKEWELSCGFLGKNIRNPYRMEYEFSNCNTIEYQTVKNFYQIFYDKKWVVLHDFNPDRICDTVPQLQIKDFWSNVLPTESVYFGKKNNYGLYNMIGNVAEMVAEKGISKGGDYYHNLFEAKTKKSVPYSKPEAWLGFRCACRYLIKPNN